MHTSITTFPAAEKTNDMTLELFLSFTVCLATVTSLNVDLHYALIAFIGASSGSIVLGYFKPEQNRRGQLVKAVMSTISGIFCGAAFARHYHFTEWEFLAMSFFFFALVSLIILKAIVSVLSADGNSLVRGVVNRFIVIEKSNVTVNAIENKD